MASTVRTWGIRTGVAAVIIGAVVGGYLAVTWVSPEKVRELVLTHLQDRFGDDVDVQLGSAQMRLLGGLSVTDLKLTRKGEDDPFVAVPHVIIFHDKQKLNKGTLEIRKIELTSPTVRVARLSDGTWDVARLHKKNADGSGDAAMPTVVVKGGTVIVTDRRPDGVPAVAVRNVALTAVNDPPEIVKVEGSGEVLAADALTSDGGVPEGVFKLPLRLAVRVHRPASHVSVHVETDEVTLGADHAALFAKISPQAAEYAERFSGVVRVTADVSTNPDPVLPAKYDVKVGVRDGRFEHDAVPWPLSQLAGTVRLCDGKVTVDKLTGKLGTATAELTVESRSDLLCPKTSGGKAEVPGVVTGVGPRWPPVLLATRLLVPPAEDPCADPMAAAEKKLDKYELKVFSLNLDGEQFAKLTPDTQGIRRMFNPSGQVDVAVRFRRPDGRGWRREVDILPKGLTIEYEHFRFPITHVYGSVKKVNAGDGLDEYQVKLTAKAGDRAISMDGRWAGGAHDSLIDLTIAGKDVLIDDKLLAALPDKYGEMLPKIGATARGDITVTLKQELNVNHWENTFRVKLYGGTVKYPQFPYTLKQVRGDVLVKNVLYDPRRPTRPGEAVAPRPDRDSVTLRNFEAVHDGGRLWLSGESKAAGTGDRKLTVNVQGENCPIDAELIAGLKAMKMEVLANQLGLKGELTFGSDIEIRERKAPVASPEQVAANTQPPESPFNPDRDLTVAVSFRGPSVCPPLFAYDLHDLAGVLRYQHGKLELENFSARHGRSVLSMKAADVRLTSGGGVWANVGGVSAAPLVVDAALLKALPAEAREELEKLNLRGSAELTVKHFVVSVPGKTAPATPPADPVRQASYRTDPDDRWKASSDRSASLVRLPLLAERRQPPSRPVVSAVAGLLPFTLPWHPPAEKVADLLPTATANAAAPVLYWNAAIKLKGAGVDLGVSCDDVYGAIASEGRYDGTDFGTVVGNAWFDRATVSQQPLTDVKASYRVVPAQPDPKRPGTTLPPALVFRDITGTAFGGTLGGQARVELSDKARFQLWLNATGVKLEELARHHKLGSGELKGDAQGTVLIETTPDPRTGKMVLGGTGQIDVPEGRLYNLPVLLELVKVLKGQTPDGVAFEEAHATFDLKGDRVKVTQLDLLGAAVSLGGSGEMDFTGKDVRFEFYTIWSQTLRRWLTTPLGDVTGLLSGGLFKIELTRVDGELVPKAHMLPAVTDPVRAMAERWRNRFDRPPAVRAAPR